MLNADQSQNQIDLSTVSLTPAAASAPQQFYNAVPVVVMIVPVVGCDPADGQEKTGVLAIRRSIEPRKGELALVGGYLEYEDWRSAGLREVREETGVDIQDPSQVKILSVESVQNGTRLLLFATANAVREADLPPFIPTNETSERIILYSAIQLAFPTHTAALKDFFSRTA